jgi:hypothetical protein
MSGSDQIFLQYFPFYSAVTEKSALTPSKREDWLQDYLFGVEGVFDPVEVAGACGLLLDQ